MKRICSLFLTLLMILALSVPAGAVNMISHLKK